MKTKWYKIEIRGEEKRTYDIKAESKEKALEMALDAVEEDWEISQAWKRSAKVEYCEEFKYNKD